MTAPSDRYLFRHLEATLPLPPSKHVKDSSKHWAPAGGLNKMLDAINTGLYICSPQIRQDVVFCIFNCASLLHCGPGWKSNHLKMWNMGLSNSMYFSHTKSATWTTLEQSADWSILLCWRYWFLTWYFRQIPTKFTLFTFFSPNLQLFFFFLSLFFFFFLFN